MKHCALFLFVYVASLSGVMGQKEIPRMYGSYVHPTMDSIIRLHHTVAVIGEVSYLSRRVNRYSPTTYDSMMNLVPIALSKDFYKTCRESKTPLTISIQHPDSTYALLRKHQVKLDSLAFYSRSELCEMLGVDAVVTIRWTIFKMRTTAEATAISVASIAGTFAMLNAGYYGFVMPLLEGGTEIISMITTIHHADGTLLYLDKGLDYTNTNTNPGGWKNRKNLRDFPYKK